MKIAIISNGMQAIAVDFGAFELGQVHHFFDCLKELWRHCVQVGSTPSGKEAPLLSIVPASPSAPNDRDGVLHCPLGDAMLLQGKTGYCLRLGPDRTQTLPDTYRALWVVSYLEALRRGALLVHSAAAVKDGKAVLFLGDSGAGKSTLWSNLSEGERLADEGNFVLPSGVVLPSMWHGAAIGEKDKLNKGQLAGLLVLEKASAPELLPVLSGRVLKLLLKVPPAAPAALPGAVNAKAFSLASGMLARHPLAVLRFPKDYRFADWDNPALNITATSSAGTADKPGSRP